jgi:hypothetical protein
MNDTMWRIRIAVLWIADVVALAAAFALATFEPGYLDEILSGKLEGMTINTGVMLLASFFWLVPLLMMYLSLVLGPAVTKWLSIILGLILGLMNLFDFTSQLATLEGVGIPRAIMVGLMAIIPFLIAWHGWKWPQEEARGKESTRLAT